MKNKYYPNLASPFRVGNLTFKNRILGAPMSSPEMDSDSCMRKEDIAFHENRGRGGLSSVCLGLGIVDPDGRTHTKEVKLYDVMSYPSLKEVVNHLHRHNCLAVMELAHGGKYAGARSHGENTIPDIYGPNDEVNPEGLPVKAMTEEDIERITDCFANAAKFCKDVGFDMILIHGGHGWLLHQFMSPSMNHRIDRWGGSLENRMRFPLLVIEKIRKACGNYPIEFRMSGAEMIQGGYGLEDGIEMAKALDGKVDILHVSAGVHEDDDVFTITHPSMFRDHGCNVYLAEEIKKHVKTPVATLGGLNDPDQMEEIIASGKADLIELARQSICDPYFPEKAFSGQADDINRCCRCYTCFYNYLTNRTFCCAFNPVVGNELESFQAPPATTPKKVIVVGGGVGGMEAAITAAQRGHSVSLYEKAPALGGALRAEQHMPFKQDMFNFVKVLEGRLAREGVEVHLGHALTAEEAAAMEPDVIMVAIGANQIIPPIPGIEEGMASGKVAGLEALHQDPPALGQKVVIIGGGHVGAEASIYLDGLGKDVTIVEMRDDWAPDAYFMHKNAMNMYIRESGIKILTNTVAKAVTDAGLVCGGPDGEITLEADSILLAAGMKPDRELADSFYNAAPRVFEIGDSIKAGRVVDAVTQGYYRALDI